MNCEILPDPRGLVLLKIAVGAYILTTKSSNVDYPRLLLSVDHDVRSQQTGVDRHRVGNLQFAQQQVDLAAEKARIEHNCIGTGRRPLRAMQELRLQHCWQLATT